MYTPFVLFKIKINPNAASINLAPAQLPYYCKHPGFLHIKFFKTSFHNSGYSNTYPSYFLTILPTENEWHYKKTYKVTKNDAMTAGKFPEESECFSECSENLAFRNYYNCCDCKHMQK